MIEDKERIMSAHHHPYRGMTLCSHNPRSSSYILPQAERHAALSCSSYRSPSLHVADRPLVDLQGLQLTQRSHIGSHRLQIFILCQKVPEAQEKDPTQ